MDFKLSLLRVFVAVAETGNIQDAADRVGRSPSAVSMALKQLEGRVGGALFESDRKNHLTELGMYLLDIARGQLTSHDRAMASVRAFAKGELGRVELACVPSVASHLLPDVIQTITARWPGVELDVRDIDTAAVVRAIERGAIEIGIAGRPRSGAVTFQPLFHDGLVLVCPAASPLAGQAGPVTWKRLAGHSVIANGIMADSDVPEIQALNAGANLMVRNTTSLLALVKAGVGATILPELSIPQDALGIRLLPLEAGNLRREVGAIRKTGTPLSPAARAFLEVFTSFVRDRVSRDGAWRNDHVLDREKRLTAQRI